MCLNSFIDFLIYAEYSYVRRKSGQVLANPGNCGHHMHVHVSKCHYYCRVYCLYNIFQIYLCVLVQRILIHKCNGILHHFVVTSGVIYRNAMARIRLHEFVLPAENDGLYSL